MKLSAIDPQRLGLMLGLAICALASSSFAGNSTGGKQKAPKSVCAANMNEVRSHMASLSGCSERNLRAKFNQVPRGTLTGLGVASGYVLEFPANALEGNFKIKVDGVVTDGEICCSQGGTWSIAGYGAISVKGRELRIGIYKFAPAESGELLPVEQRSTPARQAGGVS